MRHSTRPVAPDAHAQGGVFLSQIVPKETLSRKERIFICIFYRVMQIAFPPGNRRVRGSPAGITVGI